jgi:hypothetical protein
MSINLELLKTIENPNYNTLLDVKSFTELFLSEKVILN